MISSSYSNLQNQIGSYNSSTLKDEITNSVNLINNLEEYNKFVSENKYEYSLDKVQDLTKEAKDIINTINSLYDDNHLMNTRINELEQNQTSFNVYIQNVDDLLKTANFSYMNSNQKITKIIGYVIGNNVKGISLQIGNDPKNLINYGDVTGQGTTQDIHTISDDVYIIQVDAQTDGTPNALANAYIFYLSDGTNIKVLGPTYNISLSSTNTSPQRIFTINTTLNTWLWHYNNAKSLGMTLASIKDSGENNTIKNLIRNTAGMNAWLGGIRKFTAQAITKGKTIENSSFFNQNNDLVRGRGKDNNTWLWVNGDDFNYTNWNAGEPNDCCGQIEHFIQMYQTNGSWNDVGFNGGYLPAVYLKTINRYQVTSVTAPYQQTITSIWNPINQNTNAVTTSPAYITDTNAINTLNNITKNANVLKNIATNDVNSYRTILIQNNNLINKIIIWKDIKKIYNLSISSRDFINLLYKNLKVK